MESLTVPEPPEMVGLPPSGRTFSARRRVRWGDTRPDGRLRLDALARYLQDVANDDTRDAGFDPFTPWVVRRTSVVVDRPAVLGEMVTLTTFNGGTGSRWADRRTVVVGDDGARLEALSLWIHVDPHTGRPARLTPEFLDTYREAGQGRTVSARLRHGPPPTAGPVGERPWPLRSTDLDRLGHVNNAATWAAVEDEVTRHGLGPATFAELEYPGALEPEDPVTLRSTASTDGRALHLWLVVGDEVRASAVVASEPS